MKYSVKSGNREHVQNTRDAIKDLRPFKTGGSLWGSLSSHGSGHLTGRALNAFEVDVNYLDYVVYSFSTPIAWHHRDRGWRYVGDKFSPTTGTHQSLVRGVLSSYPYLTVGGR